MGAGAFVHLARGLVVADSWNPTHEPAVQKAANGDGHVLVKKKTTWVQVLSVLYASNSRARTLESEAERA